MQAVSPADFNRAASMDELYALLDKVGIENGWNKKEPSLWPLPRDPFVPAHWRYALAKPALDAAGRFVNTELAERRNLILNNPLPGNTYPTVRTLVAAYQMVKAGETAKSHRHTANALRLVLDTKPDAYTIVGGQRIPMEPGDVLLTPNWSWHAHANEGAGDAYWMDFLDVPTVHLLGPMFFEHHPDGIEKASGIATQSPFRFPWKQTVARLDKAQEEAPGVKRIALEPSMATIALDVVRIEAGASWQIAPSTLSAITAVMDGAGDMNSGAYSFNWERGDALAIPAARPFLFTAKQQSHLLYASDRPLLEKLDWVRPVPTQS
ncbi:MAG: cupin domain-containing protein [Alphaproteobacteria bacterium]|nr:cupin domain-containing protein [Alphaproteobacteria bacterium]